MSRMSSDAAASKSLLARVQLEAKSASATILAVVTTVGGLIAGFGIISNTQEGVIVAVTTSAIAAAGVIAHSIHTGAIEPSAISSSVIALATQVVALLVAFVVIGSGTAATVIAVVSAVVLAAAQIAHALLSKQAPA